MDIKKVILSNGEYSCDIDISVDEWKAILQDENLMTDNYMDTLIKFHSEPDHKSTCKALGIKYNVQPQSFNAIITSFSKAVQKKLNRFEIIGTEGKPTFWIISMLGKNVGEHFEWTLRPELVQAMNELNIKEEHILQKIYNNAVNKKHWVYYDWFPSYKKCVQEYQQQAISGKWEDKVFQRLVKDTTENGISDLRQKNFEWTEFENIKKNWSDIEDTIKTIASSNSIDKDNYQKVLKFLRKHTSENRYAASNRVIAAFLPNFTTTVINQNYLNAVINKLRTLLKDYPKITGNWLTDNINFINYCNSKINFKDPWHSSLFAWYLKEYFEEDDKIKKENNMIMKQYSDLLIANKNLILTGAPGTGKTFLAKEIANSLNAEIEFVQFHPSFDYTDLVEGLRPTPPDENGNIGFERKDGVFKEFCKKALKANTSFEVDNFDESWEKLLELVKNNLSNGNLTQIGSWSYGLSTKDSLRYSSLNTPSQYSFTITKQNVYDAYQNKQARPSGAFQKDMEDVVNFMKSQFHLKDYQEGTILHETENKKFVFIIDEINRGEISKIFGELFFSLDPGYRGAENKVRTQYSNLIESGDVFFEGFFVPENVYIIGTMNDIDRSVESFDFAMRRRFAWKEIKAIDRISMWDGVIDKWKDESLKRMISINTKIETIQGLGSAFHIGPAYFIKLKNYNGNFEQLWDNHLSGVLFEYLRGLPEKEKRIEELNAAYNIKAESITDATNN